LIPSTLSEENDISCLHFTQFLVTN